MTFELDLSNDIALKGGMLDVALIFLEQHIADTNNPKKFKILLEDNEELLILELWIRILLNFLRSKEIIEKIMSFKIDIVKFFLIYLRHLEKSIKRNANI